MNPENNNGPLSVLAALTLASLGLVGINLRGVSDNINSPEQSELEPETPIADLDTRRDVEVAPSSSVSMPSVFANSPLLKSLVVLGAAPFAAAVLDRLVSYFSANEDLEINEELIEEALQNLLTNEIELVEFEDSMEALIASETAYEEALYQEYFEAKKGVVAKPTDEEIKLIDDSMDAVIAYEKAYEAAIQQAESLREADREALKFEADVLRKLEIINKMQAATKIQSVARGYLVRKELAAKAKAATKIQSVARGYLVRKELAAEAKAATKIQSVARGYLVRKELAAEADAKAKAAAQEAAAKAQAAQVADIIAKQSRRGQGRG